MFGKSTNSHNNLLSHNPIGSQNQLSSSIGNKSSEFHSSSAKSHRQSIKKRMRMAYNIQLLPYHKINFKKFTTVVDEEDNMYSLLRTIFSITDQSNWRHYIPHLEVLIKKFTNNIATSNGRILQELYSPDLSNAFDGYSLQERVESMLHLSDKLFQEHLLIFIHGLIAYNRRYGILEQSSLSNHLLYRHNYEQHPPQQVFWLLSRMSVSPEAVSKIFRIYFAYSNQIPLLSVLMVVSNYIYEQPSPLIESLLQSRDFQDILCHGLNSNHYETEREAVLLYNNLLFKSAICSNFVLSQMEIHTKILSLKNQESAAFRVLLHEAQLTAETNSFITQGST